MNSESEFDHVRWYVIHTKPREEDRAEYNLRAWNQETFLPRRRQQRLNEFTGRPTRLIKPLFPRYMFVRFDANKLLHKVCFTRGVNKVVSFGGAPVPVSDDTIDLLRSRTDEEGFVRLDDELQPGDEVVIKFGVLRGLNGIFDRSLKDSERVTILLDSISYQAHITVERELIEKASASNERPR